MKRKKGNMEWALEQILPPVPPAEIESACNRVLSQLHDAMPERVEAFRFQRNGRKKAVAEVPRPTESLKPFVALVLRVVSSLADEAYCIRIRDKVSETLSETVSLGRIYSAVDRLEEKGLISQFKGVASNDPTGRVRPFYKLTPQGERALKEAMAAAQAVTGTLEDFA